MRISWVRSSLDPTAGRPCRLGATLIAFLASIACAVTDEPRADNAETVESGPTVTIVDPFQSAQLIDLTHTLGPESLYWPSGSPFTYTRDGWGFDENGNWYAAGHFAMPEHLGTHLDAPIHFGPEMWTSDEIPVARLIGPGIVIDIRDRATTDGDAMLEEQDVLDWEVDHGSLPNKAIVLVRTGWSALWPDWNAYYGSEDPFDTTTLHFPGVSPSAAAALMARGIAGVGIDTASIDPGNNTIFPAHRVLAAGSIFNLENLTQLDQLPESGFHVLALAMKIAGGTGAPARVVAVLPSH